MKASVCNVTYEDRRILCSYQIDQTDTIRERQDVLYWWLEHPVGAPNTLCLQQRRTYLYFPGRKVPGALTRGLTLNEQISGCKEHASCGICPWGVLSIINHRRDKRSEKTNSCSRRIFQKKLGETNTTRGNDISEAVIPFSASHFPVQWGISPDFLLHRSKPTNAQDPPITNPFLF